MKKWFALLVSCLALGLVTVGCGSDDEDDADAPQPSEQPAQTAEQPAETGGGKSPSAGGGGTVAVSMKNTLFVPKEVRVKVGDTVQWTNDDPFPHTVTKGSGPGPQFDSGSVNGGGTFAQKFSERGRVDYVCTIHPRQTGTVTVE